MTKKSDLVYWITEREAMRRRKEVTGETRKYGWSDDPYMGTYRYCNVRREDDKVTRWLAQNWRPTQYRAWEILLARLMNRISTLQYIKNEWDWKNETLKSLLHGLMEDGPVFGNAYTVSTNGHSMDKIDYVVDRIIVPARIWETESVQEDRYSSLAIADRWLQRMNGVSSFMSGQIIADLKNTIGHPLHTAPDWYSWSCPGPGSLRGLGEYFYDDPASVTRAYYQKHIERCWNEVRPELPEDLQNLHMQDFQNCLCEFSKFEKVKKGGHARNRYSAG